MYKRQSLGIAKEKWGVLKKRNGVLAAYPASSHSAVVDGRTFFRLTVNGLGSRADAVKPVSYTHLDVYKRQLLTYSLLL